jgi:large-conductance mechanosensitive channel
MSNYLETVQFATNNINTYLPEKNSQSTQLPSFSISPTSSKKSFTFRDNLINFLFSSNQGSIIASSIALAIGFCIKDLLSAIVDNIFKPLIIYIIIKTNITYYYDFTPLINTQNNAMNISTVMSAVVTFILLIIVSYFFTDYLVEQHNKIIQNN